MINDILNKYLNNEKNVNISNYTLNSIILLLSHIKNPHKNFKSLHIAGTNGKGSTAFMIASILQKSGYKTGLYISPHLEHITERIKINSRDIDEDLLNDYITQIDSICIQNQIYPTYFDILTAAAFKHFSDESVDVAVIETGLGGRLDSTNVILPELSIITDISLDHMHILGDKIESITIEKCGIIKPGVPVITSNTEAAVVEIIADYAKNNGSDCYLYNKDFSINGTRRESEHFIFDYRNDEISLCEVELSLFPVHQIKNAAMVITAALYLKKHLFNNITNETIYHCLKYAEVPGRFQKLCLHPLIIYDPAHNFDSLSNLITGLNTFYSHRKKIFILSMMKDKADVETLNIFDNTDVYYYPLQDQRAFIPDGSLFKKQVYDDNIITDLMIDAIKNNDIIVFTGTFRIFGDALRITKQFIRDYTDSSGIENDNKR